LKATISVPVGILDSAKENMIKEGLVTEEDFMEMAVEADKVAVDPGGFAMGCSFLAIGKVS
jgi:hypothetical protein